MECKAVQAAGRSSVLLRGEEGSNVKDTACQTEGRVKVDEHA